MRRKKGFTLIELLVVIGIIALLMAILLPTLQRVRRQAKAVFCQSNLRQWGTLWATATTENDGYFPGGNPEERPPKDWRGKPGLDWLWRGWVWAGAAFSGRTRICTKALREYYVVPWPQNL